MSELGQKRTLTANELVSVEPGPSLLIGRLRGATRFGL